MPLSIIKATLARRIKHAHAAAVTAVGSLYPQPPPLRHALDVYLHTAGETFRATKDSTVLLGWEPQPWIPPCGRKETGK